MSKIKTTLSGSEIRLIKFVGDCIQFSDYQTLYQVILIPPAGWRVPHDLAAITDGGVWDDYGRIVTGGCFHLMNSPVESEARQFVADFLPGSVPGFSDAPARLPFLEVVYSVRDAGYSLLSAAECQGDILVTVKIS